MFWTNRCLIISFCYVNQLLAVASYLLHKHESGIDLLIELSARKQINMFFQNA